MFSKKFYKLKNPSSWRRISIANWKAPNDPTVYAKLSLDISKTFEFIKEQNQNSKNKITLTHLIAKATAMTLKAYPDLNGIIKWKKIYLRKTVDIFLQVAIDTENEFEQPDLSGAKINDCDLKSLDTIAEELRSKSFHIRQKSDPQFQKTLKLLNSIPTFLISWCLRIMNFLIHNLGINLPNLGLPADPFGSAMVTSVGMLNVPAGYAPLVPISRVPLILCVGTAVPKPWIENNQIIIRPILDMRVTFDHRFIDGLTGSRMANYFKKIVENPREYF